MAAASHFNSTMFLLVVLMSSLTTSCYGQQPNQPISAVFAFGDSILDTGNNNNLLVSRCNYPPYGKDLPGGRATGRWGNGRVLSEILAEALGVKKYLPAYLDPNLSVQELTTGVCFASGGSGLDTVTSTANQAIPMAQQLSNFQNYLVKLKGLVGENKANTIVSNAMVLISAGNNDMAAGFAAGRGMMGIEAYADLLSSLATNFVNQLYGMGVRKVGFISAIPAGCTPMGRLATGGIGCYGPNPLDGASVYNSKLSNAMQALNSKLGNAQIFYIDIYTPLLRISQNPTAYGFQVSMTGCCQLMGPVCVIGDMMTCPDSSKSVFWDGVHPTEAAYKAVVAQILHNHATQLSN
ncbi:GDSL esterase/lipase At1g73610 [Linum grandiflorum]